MKGPAAAAGPMATPAPLARRQAHRGRRWGPPPRAPTALVKPTTAAHTLPNPQRSSRRHPHRHPSQRGRRRPSRPPVGLWRAPWGWWRGAWGWWRGPPRQQLLWTSRWGGGARRSRRHHHPPTTGPDGRTWSASTTPRRGSAPLAEAPAAGRCWCATWTAQRRSRWTPSGPPAQVGGCQRGVGRWVVGRSRGASPSATESRHRPPRPRRSAPRRVLAGPLTAPTPQAGTRALPLPLLLARRSDSRPRRPRAV